MLKQIDSLTSMLLLYILKKQRDATVESIMELTHMNEAEEIWWLLLVPPEH